LIEITDANPWIRMGKGKWMFVLFNITPPIDVIKEKK